MVARARHVFIVIVYVAALLIDIARRMSPLQLERPANLLAHFEVFPPQLAESANRLMAILRRYQLRIILGLALDESIIINGPDLLPALSLVSTHICLMGCSQNIQPYSKRCSAT